MLLRAVWQNNIYFPGVENKTDENETGIHDDHDEKDESTESPYLASAHEILIHEPKYINLNVKSETLLNMLNDGIDMKRLQILIQFGFDFVNLVNIADPLTKQTPFVQL